jgi:hypothetical protein
MATLGTAALLFSLMVTFWVATEAVRDLLERAVR